MAIPIPTTSNTVTRPRRHRRCRRSPSVTPEGECRNDGDAAERAQVVDRVKRGVEALAEDRRQRSRPERQGQGQQTQAHAVRGEWLLGATAASRIRNCSIF